MADILDLGIIHGGDNIDDLVYDVGVGHPKTSKEKVMKRKGRGFADKPDRKTLDEFECESSLNDASGVSGTDDRAQRSADGWILIVTGVHQEAHEDDVNELFSDYGTIKSLHLNLDRRTGFLKGYALIEYAHFKEAAAAKNALDGEEFLGSAIKVDWSFVKKPLQTASRRSSRRSIQRMTID